MVVGRGLSLINDKPSLLKDLDKAAVMSATGPETITPDRETDREMAIGLAMETTTDRDMAATTTATLTTTILR